ncbi:MAG: phosphate ABC transporter substrate-binding protein PstS family protein [Desulfamplus sp.]|nr:phosphate ABC transporter substrate-binding protein PstS family protein [Desulfamplus sp.]
MKLSREINILIAVSMVILGTLCAAVSIYSIHSNSQTEREHLRELLMSERKNNLRDLVAGAYSVLDTANFYESAQKALSDMRFGEKNQNYFLVVDTDGMFWVDPAHPELVGKVKIDMIDAEGQTYIQNIIAGAKSSKEGFVNYKDVPEGGKTPYTRLLHYKYFEKWKWVVCAGMYINDIENVLAKKEQEIQKTMLNQLIQILALFVLGLIVSVIFSSQLITKRIVRPLMKIKDAAERIGQGDFSNNIEVKASREITHLAKSVQSMQISLDLALKMTTKMREEHKNMQEQHKNMQAQQNNMQQTIESQKRSAAESNSGHAVKLKATSKAVTMAMIFILLTIFQTLAPSKMLSMAMASTNKPVKILIEGSTTVLPIAQEAAKAYMKENSNVDITVKSSGSGNGIKALIDGTVDIANSSRFIKDKEASMAYEKGSVPVPFRIAYDCIVPIIHKNNPVKNITMENLKRIYSGEIKNWKELGGNDAPIAILSRDPSSGTFEVWNEMIMADTPLTPTVQPKTSGSEVIKSVMSTPNSIGYIGIGHLNSTVKALSVNGVTASESTAVNGSYPITRPLFMFTKGFPSGELGKFINFMLEPSQGQNSVKKAGYLSIYLPTKSSGTPCPEIVPCPDCKPCPENSSISSTNPCPPCPDSKAAESNSAEINSNSISQTSSKTSNKITSDDFEKMGTKDQVTLIQKFLKNLGYNVGGIDGIWGPKVSKAYLQFQVDHKIEPVYPDISYSVIKIMEERVNN